MAPPRPSALNRPGGVPEIAGSLTTTNHSSFHLEPGSCAHPERHALEAAHEKEIAKPEAALEKTRRRYGEALQKWRNA